MRNPLTILTAILFISHISFSQTVSISGNVRNTDTKESVPAASVEVKGGTAGTFSDEKGNFKITTNKALPFKLLFTSVGYDPQEITVTSASDKLQVDFIPGSSLGAEVVVSASRVPEKILESPVAIERIAAPISAILLQRIITTC